ncbi:MAG: filamentous hemagglutinin N-terminal domain-containing protein, partial [Verrucomicrobia bacterium]|nr:filamentous hemagglutinin N-terminal domain-containing protein [Verrucomicrobiota bacterium]
MKNNSYYCWMMILGLFPATSYALPNVEKVEAGDVSISSLDSQSMVVKASDRSIIQYQAFSVGAQEKVQFIQPSASSVVLNRVVGGETSSIFGSLTSNGKVFLVNPNGIYFGPSAQVNVGSLLASTLDITNQDFLENRWTFKQSGPNSFLINQGTINAQTDVVLLSPKISNEGSIVASVGKVAMGSCEKITLNFAEDKMIGFSMEGVVSDAEIVNLGTCKAPKGEVVLSVNTARKIIDAIVNSDEILEGDTIEEEGGRIFLKGPSSLFGKTVTLSGGEKSTLSVEGEIKAQEKILISLDQVAIENATLQAQGGEISIHSSDLTLSPLATISVNASEKGDAGSVYFKSDNQMFLQGNILAKGGDLSGNGGMIKTYSEGQLNIGSLFVDTSATNGKIGSWFFNPHSLEEVDLSHNASHLQIVLKDGNILSPIHLERKGVGITLEISNPDLSLYLGADLSTQGGQIVFKSPLQLAGDGQVRINSRGGDILFKEVIEGSYFN